MGPHVLGACCLGPARSARGRVRGGLSEGFVNGASLRAGLSLADVREEVSRVSRKAIYGKGVVKFLGVSFSISGALRSPPLPSLPSFFSELAAILLFHLLSWDLEYEVNHLCFFVRVFFFLNRWKKMLLRKSRALSCCCTYSS